MIQLAILIKKRCSILQLYLVEVKFILLLKAKRNSKMPFGSRFLAASLTSAIFNKLANSLIDPPWLKD